MKREDLEIIRDFKYVNEDGHYVLTKEQLYKLTDKIQALETKTEQEKLVLSNYEWAVLIKKISSIVNKAAKLKEGSMWTPSQTKKKAERIKEMGLECLEIIKYKNIKK